MFEPRLVAEKGAIHVGFWGKNIPGKGIVSAKALRWD